MTLEQAQRAARWDWRHRTQALERIAVASWLREHLRNHTRRGLWQAEVGALWTRELCLAETLTPHSPLLWFVAAVKVVSRDMGGNMYAGICEHSDLTPEQWEWSTVLFAVGEWAIERGDWPRIAV